MRKSYPQVTRPTTGNQEIIQIFENLEGAPFQPEPEPVVGAITHQAWNMSVSKK